MRKDLFHYFEADVKTVYEAYVRAANEEFGKACSETPYHTISFGLNYSFKYNMNGGSCHIHFMPYKTGTAVGIRYTIVQLVGARYGAHDSDMKKSVEKKLGISATDVNLEMEEFLKDSNRVFDEGLKRSQDEAPVQIGNGISTADELKKFKELLDSGIITQEEFDSKKKQLLGI